MLRGAIAEMGDHNFHNDGQFRDVNGKTHIDLKRHTLKLQTQSIDIYEVKNSNELRVTKHADTLIIGGIEMVKYQYGSTKVHRAASILLHKQFRSKNLGTHLYQCLFYIYGTLIGGGTQATGARRVWVKISKIGTVNIVDVETGAVKHKNIKLIDDLDSRIWYAEDDEAQFYSDKATRVAHDYLLTLTDIPAPEGLI